MVSDVYAGDEDQRPGVRPEVAVVDVRFFVEADPEPDALARVAALVGLSNRPLVAGDVRVTAAGQLAILLDVEAVPEATCELIRRKLAQLTCVNSAVCDVTRGAARAQPA